MITPIFVYGATTAVLIVLGSAASAALWVPKRVKVSSIAADSALSAATACSLLTLLYMGSKIMGLS